MICHLALTTSKGAYEEDREIVNTSQKGHYKKYIFMLLKQEWKL